MLKIISSLESYFIDFGKSVIPSDASSLKQLSITEYWPKMYEDYVNCVTIAASQKFAKVQLQVKNATTILQSSFCCWRNKLSHQRL